MQRRRRKFKPRVVWIHDYFCRKKEKSQKVTRRLVILYVYAINGKERKILLHRITIYGKENAHQNDLSSHKTRV